MGVWPIVVGDADAAWGDLLVGSVDENAVVGEAGMVEAHFLDRPAIGQSEEEGAGDVRLGDFAGAERENGFEAIASFKKGDVMMLEFGEQGGVGIAADDESETRGEGPEAGVGLLLDGDAMLLKPVPG